MLPRLFRLLRHKDFEKIFKNGRFSVNDFFRIKSLKNNLSFTRFAFVVSSKVVRKATSRNKIKRRLREIIRSMISNIKPGFDVVIIVKKESERKSYDELTQGLEKVLKIAKLK